jgi:hypothetical protein
MTAEFQAWWEQLKSTGDICPLRLGMSREQLRAIFGEPDDTSVTSRRRPTPSIWKYGCVEFHFAQTGSLVLIYVEDADVVRLSIGLLDGLG